MELRPITLDDLDLYVSMHCDPVMMAELGGPWPRDEQPAKLRRDVASMEAGEAWIFKIIPDADTGEAAGGVSVWEHSGHWGSINEIGWMVLPAFQGKGLASAAVRAVLDKARAEGRWDVLYAFPGVTNGPSNAICRKMGFTKIDKSDFELAGRILRCNHWRIDLRVVEPT